MGCHGGGGKRKEHENKVITLKDGHKKKRKSGHPLSKGGKEGKKAPWETELFFVIDVVRKWQKPEVSDVSRDLHIATNFDLEQP